MKFTLIELEIMQRLIKGQKVSTATPYWKEIVKTLSVKIDDMHKNAVVDIKI